MYYSTEQLKFKPTPVNSKLELGEIGRIPCKADGQTVPSVRWIREDRSPLGEHIQNVDGMLVFRTVDIGDAGNYTCIASSDQGNIQATIRIDVVGMNIYNITKTVNSLLLLYITIYITDFRSQ